MRCYLNERGAESGRSIHNLFCAAVKLFLLLRARAGDRHCCLQNEPIRYKINERCVFPNAFLCLAAGYDLPASHMLHYECESYPLVNYCYFSRSRSTRRSRPTTSYRSNRTTATSTRRHRPHNTYNIHCNTSNNGFLRKRNYSNYLLSKGRVIVHSHIAVKHQFRHHRVRSVKYQCFSVAPVIHFTHVSTHYKASVKRPGWPVSELTLRALCCPSLTLISVDTCIENV